jgi:cobaltochelatase CobS
LEQIAARTGRPYMRVQHTVNTEESHIVGQWTVRDGQTVFELGPLPLAMINGWMYCADEYDFSLPSVLSVYQAVLEGKSLVIKEADAANRIIKPSPNFRFCGTGNTNGSGDETGLYQGTSIQNAANFDRFGVVIHKQYMKKAAESQILVNRVGLVKEDADKMVDFAGLVREAYDGAKISDVISPRTLIFAAKIGVKRGSFRQGIVLSFINKLSKVDREIVDGLAQRVFG